MERVPGIWKGNVHGVREGCGASASVSPLISYDARVGFDFIKMDRVRGVLYYG